MKGRTGARTLALAVLLVGFCVWILVAGSDYYRESSAISSSGTGLSRMSVGLIYESHASIHFGEDSTTEYVFSLPAGTSGVIWCAQGGYSEARVVDLSGVLQLPGAPQDANVGCVREIVSEDGTVTKFVLLESRLVVKILA